MLDNKELGLFRLTDLKHQEEIEHEVDMGFSDIYEAIDGVRDYVRFFEESLEKIFLGEGRVKAREASQ